MATKNSTSDGGFVSFLNPKTCGIYKSGGTRFKTDPKTGKRTEQVDNELLEYVDLFLSGKKTPGEARVKVKEVFEKSCIVPTYYDQRYVEPIRKLLASLNVNGVTIGELQDSGLISIRGGHGSPGNDQRSGTIPYIKVSDIRALRVNVNPTNLVPASVARRYWRGDASGINAWDLITPNRASNNIGEFAIVIPGEEQIVVTKEVYIIRIEESSKYDPFYLLWALSLKAVRDQWRRIALMQTNREDCGDRYREIIIPEPSTKSWAQKVSKPFTAYFQAIAEARESFKEAIKNASFEYVASASSFQSTDSESEDGVIEDEE